MLTMAQVEAVAKELALFKHYGLMVRFMAYTGLRAGEVAGLRVRDVKFSKGHVEVRQTAQWIKRADQESGEWVFGTPKSERSRREVPILNQKLIADLKAFKMQHPRSGDAEALFWPGSAPGSHKVDYVRVWDLASVRRHLFKPAHVCAELPSIRVHDLRHTAASLWLDAGIDDRYVSRWLGHANQNTTDIIYSHMYPSDYTKYVERFGKFSRRS